MTTTGFLGIDIGGTKVALRAEADGHEPHSSTFTWPTDGDHRHDLAALAAHVAELTRRWSPPIDSVGVAVPATTRHGRVTVWPGRPAWAGLDLRATLGALVPGARCAWADDGDLAAVAEARAARTSDAVYLGVGTGVGGGVVLGGRPIPGAAGSCEVGHTIVALDGPRCDCGRAGCLQALASGPAVLRRATGLRGTDTSFADLRDGLAAGEEWALSSLRTGARALAAAAVSLTELVRPAVVIVGGGFAAGVPDYVDEVRLEADRLARPGHPVPPVRAAALGGLSSLHGAVLLARTGRFAP